MNTTVENKLNRTIEYLKKGEVVSSEEKMSLYDIAYILNEDYLKMTYKLYYQLNLEESINEICRIPKKERVEVVYSVVDNKLNISLNFLKNNVVYEHFTISKLMGDDKLVFNKQPRESKIQDILIANYNLILDVFDILEDYYYLFKEFNTLSAHDEYFNISFDFDDYFGITGYISDVTNEDKRTLPFNSRVVGTHSCFSDKILKRISINTSELPDEYKLLIAEHDRHERNIQKAKK